VGRWNGVLRKKSFEAKSRKICEMAGFFEEKEKADGKTHQGTNTTSRMMRVAAAAAEEISDFAVR